MRIPRFLEVFQMRRRQAKDMRDIDRSDIQYSEGDGQTLDDPVVVTGAGSDAEGTHAVFAWLQRRYGVLGQDWVLTNRTGHSAQGKRIDWYTVTLKTGETNLHYFDVSQSYLK